MHDRYLSVMDKYEIGRRSMGYLFKREDYGTKEYFLVKHFITVLLNNSSYVEDIIALAPSQLKGCLGLSTDIFTKSRLTEERIKEIHSHNSQALQIINERLLIKLLEN